MNATGSQEGSSRVEREVLEILERAEASQTPVDQLQATVRRQRATVGAKLAPSSVEGPLRSLFATDIARIAGSLLLALLAALLSDASRLLAFVLAIASVLLLLSLWLPSRGSSPGGAPRWRGQDLRGPGPPPFGRDRNGPPKTPR